MHAAKPNPKAFTAPTRDPRGAGATSRSGRHAPPAHGVAVRGTRWSRALAAGLPVLLAQGLIYSLVTSSLGVERVAGAVVGLMMLAPVIVALCHVAGREPVPRPPRTNLRGLRV